MYIDGHRYYRGSEQCARGLYLALFAHDENAATEELNRPIFGPVDIKPNRQLGQPTSIPNHCTCAGNPLYYQKYCTVHKTDWITANVDTRKLYAYIGRVAMRQVGHFMMGRLRIGNQWLTVSGQCGSDSLPLTVEKVLPKYRSKLIAIPQDIADVYWASDGHNELNSLARKTLRDYASSLLTK